MKPDLAHLRKSAGAAAIALALHITTAAAVVLPPDVTDALQQRMNAFVAVEGYKLVAPDTITGDGWLTPDRFPNAQESVFRPDSEIGPATKAILMLESQEVPLPHVRYRITLTRVAASPDYPDVFADLVEITRFNLGPAIRDQLIRDIGPDHVGDVESFGVGPSISWRFATRPIQGNAAALEVAGRDRLSRDEARRADCLGTRCLSLDNPTGPDGDWQPVDAPRAREVTYAARDGMNASAARVADALMHAAAPNGFEPAEGPSRDPQMTVVISKDIVGQDSNIDGLLHQARLMDDAISDIWWKRRQAGPDLVDWSRLVVHWPGRD